MAHTRYMLDKQGYMHARFRAYIRTHGSARTHRPICNTYCFSTATMIRERASVLRYTYIVCIIDIFSVECVRLTVNCHFGWELSESWHAKDTFSALVAWDSKLCVTFVLKWQEWGAEEWEEISAENIRKGSEVETKWNKITEHPIFIHVCEIHFQYFCCACRQCGRWTRIHLHTRPLLGVLHLWI
jgi:hypothetical protein